MRGRLACLLALSSAFASALADDAPKQPFIVRTHVVAPHKVGDFVLEGARYDSANKLAGVGVRYFLPGHEEARIDLFVYPHGQADTEAALDQGMRDFRATLEAAAKAGYYRDLAVADAVEFDVPLPPSVPVPGIAESPAPADDAAAAPAEDAADPEEAGRIAMLAGLLGANRRVDGRLIALHYESPGLAEGEWLLMRSRGYLFYRHLYFFKGRISAAESRIDPAAFEALADRAMRELVPAVQAYNIGSCGDVTLYVDPDLPEREAVDALMRELVAAQTRSEASNCHAKSEESEVAALAEDADVVTIEYAPEDWGGQ
ncbi:MAG: hypothetical protein KIS72_10885 [Luteimonas sp.]|nr:hypothetical protein [Luteimonas sp.]